MRTSVDVHNALVELDVPHELVPIRGRLRRADRIAAVLGLSPDEVGKVWLFDAGGRVFAAVTSLSRRPDASRVATAAGAPQAREIKAARTSALTGYLSEAPGHRADDRRAVARAVKTRFAVSSGGVVVRRKGEGWETVLASRRTRAGQLVWGLAKGQIEESESPQTAAVREVEEETGITARILEPLGEISYWFVWDGERVKKTVHFFLMEATGGDASLHDQEMEEVAWFPLEEAPGVAGYASEKKVLQRARALLTGAA
ncbi:MAG: NUDIX hydrolase [Actinobacteria bacterium]|nr:NUDIX hydrolase [Actinomycetota bacterium]